MYDNIDIKKLLGKRVKEFRQKRGLTQEELAEKIDITQRTLSKIECGSNFVTSETLSKIINALNVKACDLFDFEHKKDLKALKDELLTAIKNETTDIRLLYKFYKII